ncbi:MAG: O-antigen ligase family protein [bacterium]
MKKIEKITNLLILAFLFFLPWQTRYIYEYGYLNNGSWEYGTYSIYAIEILLWIIIILFAINKFAKRDFFIQICSPANFKKNCRPATFVIIFIIFNICMLATSLDFELSYQHVVRVLGAICLGMVILSNAPRVKSALIVFWVGGVVQGALAIFQFFAQKVWACKWLGMASHSAADQGASVVEFAGERWLRAYGSFGWPNILGGYLAIVFIVGLLIILINSRCISNHIGAYHSFSYKWLINAGQIVVLAGLILSFSRGAWIALAIGVASLLLISKKLFKQGEFCCSPIYFLSKQFFYGIILLVCAMIILFPLFLARFNLMNRVEQTSISEHKYQYVDASNAIYNNFWLGSGAGAYTLLQFQEEPNLESWQYQPIHNIFVLIFAETGILGILIYGIIFASVFLFVWKNNRLFAPLLITMAVLGIFDHWLWTIYTGLVLWWIVSAISLKKIAKNSHI